jgi:uncharacterized protein YbjT (DUF2867 family)
MIRARVKVVVRDVPAARSAYGPYVTPVSLDIGSPSELKRALKGVAAIVALGKLGAIPKVRSGLLRSGGHTTVCAIGWCLRRR